MKRAYRYRFYPTDAQAAELSRTFGCVRKVYNMALQACTKAWALNQERVSYGATSAMLTQWKKTEDLAYLSEVSSVPLQQTLRHLQGAFTNFWQKRAKYPRFKSRKKSRKSAEYTRSAFRFRDGRLWLAKMAGRWFVSMLCDDRPAMPVPVSAAVGIDVGIISVVTLSTGEKITNPRQESKGRERLAKAQRDLARKAEGDGMNRAKARRRVARVHARVADRGRDFLHKLTTRLVRENQTIVIEDLTVRDILKNRRLSRVVSDASWTEMRSMLEYKTDWYGRELIVIDRWFPSSKLCSSCGTLQGRMQLDVREWTCGCGATHDRDVNAAINILAAGLAVAACGDGVRPQRSTPGGQSSMKQEVVPPPRSRAAGQSRG
ncbi:transposase [Kitasatospora sp. MMS16-BH015]|uniref:RNA-guided endonuclease InsQ/TnpB family protein n=1 Tax=Kitasatospora sp. MMS16-BH015 TaxID=2018025 RepID=UPI000CA2AF09|nr:RNA-guided endonuclease TnpB family protein [Kitasatospora sp. MMS16-BH015]AUG81808.1 transposase [Kitasatospora sp. MMS16-BH015]